jgi:cytosine/adenosine deaminase-related metal-dependent hydrolase
VIHRAAWVWAGPGRLYSPGEVVTERGRVVAVRPARARTVPERVLLPALVNAHVHLQIDSLAEAPRGFTGWVRAVLRQRAASSAPARQALAREALGALAAEGVRAVGEIDSTGESPAALRGGEIGGRCYQELVGFALGAREARREVARRGVPGTRACPFGLSPHAPYSVSPELFRAAARRSRFLAVHLAEVEEECELLRAGTGPLRELLVELGKLPARWRPPRCTPAEHLDRLGVLRRGTLLVHCQHLSGGDTDTVAARGASIAVCPGTIRYFDRRPPPVGRWLSSGIAVALGTDSRASNSTLSLRAELRVARDLWPELEPEQLLAMATVHGTRALGSPAVPAAWNELRWQGRWSPELLLDAVSGQAPMSPLR